MASQAWNSLINTASVQGTGAGAVLNTATTATISPVTGSGADVAQVLGVSEPDGWYPGMLLRVWAYGSTTLSPGGTTLTFSLASRAGNTGGSYVTLASTAGITSGAITGTGFQWKLTAVIRCIAVATSGNTLATFGEMPFYLGGGSSYAGAGNTETAFLTAAGGGESLAAVDTTQLQGISLRCTLSSANASVQLAQWLVEGIC